MFAGLTQFIMANLQHQLDYYPPYDGTLGAFVGVQERFPKDFPKVNASDRLLPAT